jgi:DUF2889 family protein
LKSLEDLKKSRMHKRDILISTFSTGDKNIIVEGQLIDNKLIDTYHYSGDNRSPDTIHHLIIRLLINPKLTILEVETEMPRTPHEECLETQDSLQILKGMKIARGFTMKIKELFSNGKGCSHLAELIISMAPAVVQGFWTSFSSQPLPKDTVDSMKLLLNNTCWAWRSNGPLMKRLGS